MELRPPNKDYRREAGKVKNTCDTKRSWTHVGVTPSEYRLQESGAGKVKTTCGAERSWIHVGLQLLNTDYRRRRGQSESTCSTKSN